MCKDDVHYLVGKQKFKLRGRAFLYELGVEQNDSVSRYGGGLYGSRDKHFVTVEKAAEKGMTKKQPHGGLADFLSQVDVGGKHRFTPSRFRSKGRF